jgi:ubiquinol-cytochrome c reductase iron-sulfur subunit
MEIRAVTDVIDEQRRRFLIASTAAFGGIGVAGAAVPFVASLQPSGKARADAAPRKATIGALAPGQQMTLEWRGQPVLILHRTQQMINDLERLRSRLRDPDSERSSQQPLYATNAFRAVKSEYLVVIGLCTHLGCVPRFRPEIALADLGPEWRGGYFCPCHGAKFDLAGRVYRGVPAPANLVVPPHRYLSDTAILVGVD